MEDITAIPITELLDDLIESAEDRRLCKFYAEMHPRGDNQYATRERVNGEIIDKIRSEIIRRVQGQG